MKKIENNEKQPKITGALLRTYLTSLLCMVLCVAMFFGTSYAWFTSEIENKGNEIYIGILSIDLQDANGNSLKGNARQLFDKTIRWEPGYTALETVKVVNQEGSLAFRYELTMKEDGNSALNGMSVKDVAKWFDVWCYHDANNSVPAPANYDEITNGGNWTKVGRLDQVLSGKVVFRGNMTQDEIAANPTAAHTYTIALHMNGTDITEEDQEDFNKLMGLKIGLDVKLVATQLSSETDAFGATYDLEAYADKLANVTKIDPGTVKCNSWGNNSKTEIELDVAYQFQPDESYDEALKAPYKNFVADFVVSADKDVPAESMALAGYYEAYCKYHNNDNWVVLTSPAPIAAGQEVRLVASMDAGVVVTYEAICMLGNDGIGFLCGAADVSDAKVNSGTTITVELRMYEVDDAGKETGRYIVVGDSYKYTFE